MSRPRLATIVRGLAAAIAVAALIDPAVTRGVRVPHALAVIAMSEAVLPSAGVLADALDDTHDVSVAVHQTTAQAAACPPSGGCVLVSAGEVPARLTAGATVVGALLDEEAGKSRVIATVGSRSRVHRNSRALLHIALRRPVERIEVRDGDVVVGHARPGEATEAEVHWTPLDAGPRLLRVSAGSDEVDVPVVVETGTFDVLWYESEPSWPATFVRRVLESDQRFTVTGRTQVAPGIAVERGAAAPLAVALAHARVVVIATPQRLTSSDIESLGRFVRERGGSVVCLLDEEPRGDLLRLLPAGTRHTRTSPVTAGALRTREWIAFDGAPGLSTLAAVDGRPVVVARSLGRGHVIAFGVMDAWQYRDAVFDRFWSSLLWDAVMVADADVRVTLESASPVAGEQTTLRFEEQAARASETYEASAHADCAGQRVPLRPWPDGAPGRFRVDFRPERTGACTIVGTVNGATGQLVVPVAAEPRRPLPSPQRLHAIAAAHGGLVASVTDSAALVDRARGALPPQTERRDTHPLRSPLWLLPFLGCLFTEWWLRRRSGWR